MGRLSRTKRRRKKTQRRARTKAKGPRPASKLRDARTENDLDFLINCITSFHEEVFGSCAEPARVRGEPSIKYAMETPSHLWFIAIDPSPDQFFFMQLPRINNSMFFAGLVEGSGPIVSGKPVRGFYVINSKGLEYWLSHTLSIDNESFRDTHQKVAIAQLAAHEVRHEVQAFSPHKRHRVSELRSIAPQIFKGWQDKTLSVFKPDSDPARIAREEDAIVVEQLVQASCYEGVMEGSNVVEINIQKIAQLIRA